MRIDALYPPGPAAVPPSLTKPTSRFRLHAWLAVVVLLLFVALYFFLTGWFGWTAFRLVRDGFASGSAFMGILKAIPAAFLFLFLFRGLFAVKHAQSPAAIEVHPQKEPELFAFLNRIADEVGAPRAHRVFVSPDVNAGVFYDLSLLNLLIPTKKNLEIGLGAINALTLGELKAVLAHEFGHFAQRTMTVGRWVYMAEQVAGHIIATRGIFDKILAFISAIDIRIAWIGWIMRLLVWSMRAVLDTAFRAVVFSRRALSREMELQADLVAVSLTGSDALVHGLHKLHAADDAYGRALAFAQGEVQRGKAPEDLFAVQSRMMESVRRITNDDTYGVAPKLPESNRESHRVFPDHFAQPPKMWSTHPPNREREDNAKRTYIEAPLDDRPAWLLLADADVLRRDMTRHFLQLINQDKGLPTEALSVEESMEAVDSHFGVTYLQARYRGLYLGRGVVEFASRVSDLFDETIVAGENELTRDTVRTEIDNLYPPELVGELEAWRDLEEEHARLQALKDGFLTAPGGVVRYRGEEIRRRDLGGVIERVGAERDEARERVLDRDRACRSWHRIAARHLGGGWEEYHTSLVALLHYAEHTEADLRDVDGRLQNVFSVVIADGRVSGAERRRLVTSANDAWGTLARAFQQSTEVHLPPAVAGRLEVDSWAALLGEFTLNPAREEDIGDWLQAADSWLLTVANDLGALKRVTLEVLLDAEEHISRCIHGECERSDAPELAAVPANYVTLIPGQERERQKKLDFWDRFQLAEGIIPGAARLGVAAAVLGGAFLLGGSVALDRSMIVHNGLGTAVAVEIGDQNVSLRSHGHVAVDLEDVESVHIRTQTAAGALVEELDADVSNTQAQYVYNVAGAAPLAEWTAVYGGSYEPPPRMLGAPRITTTRADFVFDDPPESIRSSRGGSTRLVLASLAAEDPSEQLSILETDAQKAAVALAHARFDPSNAPDLHLWLRHAASEPEFASILERRLEENAADVNLLRVQQDVADDRHAVCEAQRGRLEEIGGADAEYLRTRCMDDRVLKRDAYIAGYHRYPDHPFFAGAAGELLAAGGDWAEGKDALEFAFRERRDPHLAVDLARVRRMLSPQPRDAFIYDLVEHSPSLARLSATDASRGGAPSPFTLLQEGQLEEAVDQAYAQALEGADAYLRLAAASEGASPDLIARALALAPEQGNGATTVWSSLALAAREGADPAPYRAVVPEGYDDIELLLAWADPEEVRTNRDALEANLHYLDPWARGHARVMGLILLGDEAPEQWRREAQALLFDTERPYFRAPEATQGP